MKYVEPSIVVPELEDAPIVKSRLWTREELDILWAYRNRDPKAIAKYLGRSVDAVKLQLRRIKDSRGAIEGPAREIRRGEGNF